MDAAAAQARIVDAARQGLEEEGWRGLERASLLSRSGLEAAELQRLAPTPLAALKLVLQHVDAAVLDEGPADAADAPRDRLFEIMMRRYEALVPWRAALRRISRSLPPPDPFAAVGLALAVERSMAAMLEAAGISPAGLAGALRVRGLGLVHAAVLRVFLDDDTVDLAHTMKALDQRLRQAEGMAAFLNQFDRFPRTAAKEMGSDMHPDSTGEAARNPQQNP
ncbi:MAG: TetR/AcrR family transcriptional regulator [Reyranellaceae bacterium]